MEIRAALGSYTVGVGDDDDRVVPMVGSDVKPYCSKKDMQHARRFVQNSGSLNQLTRLGIGSFLNQLDLL